ncbi:hypothetical protein QA811_02120 [Streptomyces sp. B21-102]|uniref:hypothetical protein n=1 Tax=Streptomyces sp. B21-102 TaxID=3039416 RepID=UPI002FEF9640
MTPADELRAAAAKIRDLTAEATGAPWATSWSEQQYEVKSPSGIDPIAEWTYAIATWEPEASEQRAECDTADADWIATMHPGVGTALARWLENTATSLTASTHPGWQDLIAADALAVARAVLGTPDQT